MHRYFAAILVAWGLRDYGIPPSIWGGDPVCEHVWVEHYKPPPGGKSASSSGLNGVQTSVKYRERLEEQHQMKGVTTNFCCHCGAWRGAHGLEPTIDLYVRNAVEIFRAVHRVLRPDGSLWLNLGDSYAGSWGAQDHRVTESNDPSWHGSQIKNHPKRSSQTGTIRDAGLKPKDLCGIPWRVAFALQADGWWLRQDIIWSKPNPMPESVTDRCTKSHEYMFLLTKSARYFYDAEAIKEDVTGNAHARGNGVNPKCTEPGSGIKQNSSFSGAVNELVSIRNKRSVWTVATSPFNGSQLLADYVGPDGKPYKRSEDCPIHGRHDRPGTRRMVSSDEPSSPPSPHNPDSDSHLGEAHASSLDATPLMSSYTNYVETSPEREPQSIPENRTLAPLPTLPADGLGDDGEFLSRSDDMPALSNSQDRETDLPRRMYAEPATPNSTEIHRTVPALGTNPAYSASAQTPRRIGGTLALLGLFDSVERSHESNTSPAGLPVHPSAQKASRSARKSSLAQSICTCVPVSTDHFATFPPDLIIDCIKAGTSEKGCCAKCGAPWKREITSSYDTEGRTTNGPRSLERRHEKPGFEVRAVKNTQTTGWRPTCECDAAVVPATILDPFGGSGTTGLVADRLQRNAILIELNPDYAAMAQRRIAADAVPLFAMSSQP